MRLISSGQHHATFEFGDLQVVSLRDGYIDMPPTRLRDEDGRTLDELPAAVPLAGDNLPARLLPVSCFFDHGSLPLHLQPAAYVRTISGRCPFRGACQA